jgi:hypothetical protein
MTIRADEYPNPSDGKSPGQAGVPLAPGSDPSTTRPRRRAKWFIGGALVLALFTAGAAGIAVANHLRQVGSARPATSSATALQQWWAGAGKDFTDMGDASDDVDQALGHFRPGALAASCQHMNDAAAVKMRSHLPSPDQKLTAELNAAIKNFHFAAHLCLTAVAGSPANYDGEFLSLMAQANKHMQAAQRIIDQRLTNV